MLLLSFDGDVVVSEQRVTRSYVGDLDVVVVVVRRCRSHRRERAASDEVERQRHVSDFNIEVLIF